MTLLLKSKLAGLGLICMLALISCSTQPDASGSSSVAIGLVTASKGYPEVFRKNRTYILAAQSRIYAEDIVKTDKNSKVAIQMLDDTTFALGPGSHFVLHNYKYSPDMTAPVAQMSITSGSLRTRTANLMKAKKPSFEIRTPLAVVGVRGTDFWSGFLFGENTLDVAMIEGKGIYIQNPHGAVDIYSDGHGTTVIGDSAPQPPKAWSSRKINRALSVTDI